MISDIYSLPYGEEHSRKRKRLVRSRLLSNEFAYSWGYIAVGVGTLAAGLISGNQNKPKTAALKTINPQTEQSAAIQGNIANEDQIEQLTTRANKYTQGQANDLMEQAMPGYSKLAGKLTGIATTNLDNPSALPQDVQDNISRIAAEKGISTGIHGEAGNFNLLKDFGVDSINYRNNQIAQSQSILSTLSSTAPRVNPLSPMSLYITPSQQIAVTGSNNSGQQAVSQSANNASAAASNANASMWGQTVSTLGGIAGGYLNSQNGGTAKPAATPAAAAKDGSQYASPTGQDWTWVPGQGYQLK